MHTFSDSDVLSSRTLGSCDWDLWSCRPKHQRSRRRRRRSGRLLFVELSGLLVDSFTITSGCCYALQGRPQNLLPAEKLIPLLQDLQSPQVRVRCAIINQVPGPSSSSSSRSSLLLLSFARYLTDQRELPQPHRPSPRASDISL